RYKDSNITIYQRKLDYYVENPTAIQAEKLNNSFLKYKSIDVMQWSRDRVRERELNGTPTDAQIQSVLDSAVKMNPTHIAIGTPYDDEFLWYLKIWVQEIRKRNTKVWFRGNFSGWEGWYDYKRTLTPKQLLDKTY